MGRKNAWPADLHYCANCLKLFLNVYSYPSPEQLTFDKLIKQNLDNTRITTIKVLDVLITSIHKKFSNTKPCQASRHN
ncbi:hypothetical protein L596_021348 [Steinernema carpocapsae]|uniref:Uncharacterized protein n=1 Tax=Steinernema carpocapsae TaxID=34508 RepID=A0A4U5MIF5_STECR|nr:hypothetical protein L596_021348 [Steinernema carpocapsae]